MADFQSSVVIAQPVEVVFKYVASMENMPEIMPNVVNIDKRGLGQLKSGDKVVETRMIRGRETESELEITAFEENKLFAYKSETNGLQSVYWYSFEEVEEGRTRASFKADIKTTGIVMGLTKRFIVNMLKREDGNQMVYLKDMLEGKANS
ncbi:Polyketide cyclase / dehydrase and lipid transport [Bacillus sp. B-jedd]|nr:Polyketide cyclase / dehydrase and lipid transport [Bacillus sp. B-jedd]